MIRILLSNLAVARSSRAGSANKLTSMSTEPITPKLCKKGLHDLSIPSNVRGKGQGARVCRICDNARKEFYRLARRNRQNFCRGCKTSLPLGRTWPFCTSACEKKYRTTYHQYSSEKDAARNELLMTLYKELDRASMSWEKEDLRAKIREVISSSKV
jgi:hypothetical protein